MAHTDEKSRLGFFKGVRTVRTVSIVQKTSILQGFYQSQNTSGLVFCDCESV